jgi:hypothetical protein
MDGAAGLGLGLALFALLSLWPARRILRRAGLAAGWCLLVLLPVAGHAALYGVLAFRRWPNRPPAPVKAPPKPRRVVP